LEFVIATPHAKAGKNYLSTNHKKRGGTIIRGGTLSLCGGESVYTEMMGHILSLKVGGGKDNHLFGRTIHGKEKTRERGRQN